MIAWQITYLLIKKLLKSQLLKKLKCEFRTKEVSAVNQLSSHILFVHFFNSWPTFFLHSLCSFFQLLSESNDGHSQKHPPSPNNDQHHELCTKTVVRINGTATLSSCYGPSQSHACVFYAEQHGLSHVFKNLLSQTDEREHTRMSNLPVMKI